MAASGALAAATITLPAETLNGVAKFDWAPTSVYAENGNLAFVDWANTGGVCTGTTSGCMFDVYAHGSLSAFLNSNDQAIASGVGTAYEVTFELGFSEKVILAVSAGGQNFASFGFGPSGKTTGITAADAVMSDGVTPNFFRMYYDPVVNADPLAGTGYGPGTLMLSGSVLPAAPSFQSSFLAGTSAAVPLGGYATAAGALAWGATTSVTGAGASNTLDLLVPPTTVDKSFFAGNDVVEFLLASITQNLPFIGTDPSLTFPEGSIADAKTGVGAVNGGTSVGGGGELVADADDIIFMTDPNSPVKAVPEPAGLALFSLGLLGLGAARRRAKR
jgi:hypothetical protein